MNFNIGEETEEQKEDNGSKRKIMSIVIIVIISIIVGLLVFFVSNALFGKKKEEEKPIVATKMDLHDENVEILYAYVTYGTRNSRNDKFLKEKNVTLSSFSDQEKFYYALQFAQVEDFVYNGKVNEKNQKIYQISSRTIKTYMERFFGNKVTYSPNVVITYPFSFRINNKNVGTLTYSSTSDSYETVFDDLEEDIVSTEVVEPYYTELVEAMKNPDGTVELQEKVIYTESIVDNGNYVVKIYSDYEHTNLIETKQNITAEYLKQNPINIDNYLNKAGTISYLFKLNGTTLYFDSSRILSSTETTSE